MSGKRWCVLIGPLALLACCANGVLSLSAGQSTLPSPLVRVGVGEGESPCRLSGGIQRLEDGTLSLPAQPVADGWGWVTVGRDRQALDSLEGLQSFTICGWLAPSSLQTGSGGNRIAFNLNYNRSGFDLVHLDDGRLRLAVNEWPDGIRNDSSPGKLKPGEWTFFAVTYDGTKETKNVCWYFGGPGSAIELDRRTSYPAGSTGTNSGPLTVGNYNQTIHRHGNDRQFRGYLHGIQIFGGQRGADGALEEETIRQIQADEATQPDFTMKPEKARATPLLHSTIRTDPAEPSVTIPTPPSGTRPRIVATTDGEIDDRCSMVRFLLYANEWDIEGIVYSSSKFH